MTIISVLYRPLLFNHRTVKSSISSPLTHHTFFPITSTNPKPISQFCSLPSSSSSLSPMDSASDSEIAYDYSPMLRIYKDGRIERLMGTEIEPPSLDPQNAVVSKDVVYSPENSLSVRIFIPRDIAVKKDNSNIEKLPLLVYFHGGGFIIGSPFNPPYHRFLETVVSETNCVAVSVEYRRAPEHPVPAAHEDSWAALKWVAAHVTGDGPEQWLNRYADLGNVFFAGDSAGGNIAHHMAMKAAKERISGDLGVTLGITGLILIHPYFWGKQPIDEKEIQDATVRSQLAAIWSIASPGSVDGNDDPILNVFSDAAPSLAGLGCGRVLVFVAEKDLLARRGWVYAEMLKKSGWEGKEEDVEVVEAEGETHVFHLGNPTCENAVDMVNRITSFITKK